MKNKGSLKFILISIIGFILLLVPLPFKGESKIFISHATSFIIDNLFDPFVLFTTIVATLVILLTFVFAFYTSKNNLLNSIFKTSKFNVFGRITGSFMYLVVLNQWFSGNFIADAINDPYTGGVMVGNHGLLSTLYITFFIGVFTLPLITDFGAVEYIGTVASTFVKKFFKVPGYSAVDALASFVGDGTMGIVVTDNQYKKGYYTKREAYIIASSFSIVGIAFATSVSEELGFGGIFPIFYFSIFFVCALIAMVTARLPLKKFKDEYYPGVTPKTEELPSGVSKYQHALESASNQAHNASVSKAVKNAFVTIINIYVGFLPIIMLVGTVSLVIAEQTSFFTILSTPLVPLYSFLFDPSIAPDLAAASIVGFADMYLPALFIVGVSSSAAKFFIGVMSFTQLIFMSETGMVLVNTKIGVDLFDVIKIFVYRTMLSIPIVYAITYGLSLMNIVSF